MKLIVIPPYRHPGVNYNPQKGHFLVREIIENIRHKGQLKNVEIDIDEGYPTDVGEERDEEFLAGITPGFLKRVKQISEMGNHDGIVTSGGLEPGFFAGRMMAKIPIAFCVHSAVHVASLIGDKFSIIQLDDPGAQIIRHYVQLFGLGHKLTSARYISRTSTYLMKFVSRHAKGDRTKVPEIKEMIDDIINQSIKAIEREHVDSIILGGPYLEILETEIRLALDDLGYREIQLICEVSAAVEMAKTMVNMKLIQSPRAYPDDNLIKKPEYR